MDHFTPQHKAFEQSTACLSVVLSYFLVLFRMQHCEFYNIIMMITILEWTESNVQQNIERL